MRVRILGAVCALLCVGGSLLLTRCADKGTDPPPDGPKDYAVYVRDFGAGVGAIFRYRPALGELDSAGLPPQGRLFPRWVSADGKRLFWGKGVVTDAETFEILPSLPLEGDIAISPDNQLIAICDTDLFIVRASDYGFVFHDTDAVVGATFSTNSRRFYAKKATVGDCDPMYVLDLEHGNQVTRRCIKGGMGSEPLVLSPDETKLYFYKHYGTFWYSFDVYDLSIDSVVFSEPLTPGAGSLAQTPDGKDVYFTNPGDLLAGPPVTYALAVYHVETMTIDTFLTRGPVCWSDGTWFLPYKDIVITADGRWLVGTSKEVMTILGRNLRTGETTTRCLPGRWFKFPRTQSGL